MSKKLKAFWWFLTALACVFEGVWALAGTPNWWGTAIAIVIAISGIVFGKPWKLPEGP